jgi:hypothetical protein
MWKSIVAGTAAFAIAGTSLVHAQQTAFCRAAIGLWPFISPQILLIHDVYNESVAS